MNCESDRRGEASLLSSGKQQVSSQFLQKHLGLSVGESTATMREKTITARIIVLASTLLACVVAHCAKADSPLEFVQRYCVDCHNADEAEANFRVDNLSGDFEKEFGSWANIHRRIERGEMPPANYEQPSSSDRQALVSSLRRTLTDTDRKRQAEFGRRELRRLSRAEYANTLKDLLDLPHLEIEGMLPPDGRAYGFQKSAKALDFSHVLMSRYLEVADPALRQALAESAEPIASRVVRGELDSVDGVDKTLQTLRVQLKQGIAIPLIEDRRDTSLIRIRGNFARRDPGKLEDPPPHFNGVLTMMNSRSNHNIVVKPFKVPQSGVYKIRVHGWGMRNDHGKLLPGTRTETVAFYSKSGRLLGRCDLPANVPTTSEITTWLVKDEPVEYLAISTDNEKFNFASKAETKYETFAANGIALQWFEMEGPLATPWPPQSHRRLLGDLPLEPIESQSSDLPYRVVTKRPEADARRLLRRFAARAYRRPVQGDDLRVPMQMVRRRLSAGQPFIEAMLSGYRAILTSPEFLLLSEQPGELDAWGLGVTIVLLPCECGAGRSTTSGGSHRRTVGPECLAATHQSFTRCTLRAAFRDKLSWRLGRPEEHRIDRAGRESLPGTQRVANRINGRRDACFF